MTTQSIAWTDSALPVGLTIDQLLYRVRRHDEGGLIFDSVTLDELLEESEAQLALDAMVTPYNKLGRKASALQAIMTRSVPELQVAAMQVSDPFKQNGTANVVVLFELSDGQTVSVYFHNPDATPSKILPTDELVSWKWLLNKKDITIVVAPERGNDLAVREVGRRIMKLAAKNSAAFARVNAQRSVRLQNIADLRGEVEQLEGELNGLLKEIEVAELEAENRALAESQKPTAEKGLAALNSVRQFLSRGQFKTIAEAMKGEDGRFFIDKAVVLAQLIDGMAKTYEQDGKDDPTAYLHYFKGSADWHITEKDMSGKGTEQAFGLSDLGQGGELGYISIDELVRNNVELDLHFEPKPLSAVRKPAPEADPAQGGGEPVDVFSEASKPFDDYLSGAGGDLFQAANDYFKTELKGRLKFVNTAIGKVYLTGAGWKEMKRGMKSDDLKARLTPHIPEVLTAGAYGGRSAPHKERSDGFVAFHFFEKDIDLGEVVVTAGINVGEREDGMYEYTAYGLGHSLQEAWAKRKASDSPGNEPGTEAFPGSVSAALDSTLGEDGDGINIVILKVIDKATGQRVPELEDAPAEAETETPTPQPEVADYSQFPVIGSDTIWGDIIEVPTAYGETARVARAQLMDPVRAVLAQYTKAGKRKVGYGIHRGNLLIHGNALTEAAQLEKDMRESGLWEVARFPRSPEQQMKLLGQGYTGYVKDERSGEMIPSPLGLVWAKPIPQAVEAPEDGAQGVEAVARWLTVLGWSVSAPDERGDVMASLDGMSLTLGASPSGKLDYDGEPLDVLLSAKEAAYQIHAEYRYGDPRENRERLGIDDPADEDDADFDESSWHSEAFNQSAIIVKDTAERLGGRVSFGDFTNSISGGLFDSVAAVPYGICAQIGTNGRGIGRAAIEEGGKVLVYVGLSGGEVVTVGGQPADAADSHAGIVAMLEALFRQAAAASPGKTEDEPATEADVSQARAEVDTDPTDEQKQSGDYQKGELSLFGLDIAIENPQGSTRSGKSEDGAEWSSIMSVDYGFIRGTLGADGDEVDVFVGPDLQSETAFVIAQVGKEGAFDEYKTLLGFTSEADARSAYLGSYSPDWDGLGEIRAMSVDEFKSWLGSDAPRQAPDPVSASAEPDLQSEPTTEPAAAARDLFQAVIDGDVSAVAPDLEDGMLDAGLVQKLQDAYGQVAGDAELEALFERAADALTVVMLKATEGVQ